MTRPITPHKGGRTKTLGNVRVTEETKERIAAVVAQRNAERTGKRYTVADWIEEKSMEAARTGERAEKE
jgi:hypothetical protein